MVANVPATATSLPAGVTANGQQLPAGALQTRTDFGVPCYGGLWPPQSTTHRYRVTLMAIKLDKLHAVTADATPALGGFFAKANSLGSAMLTITHGR